jgi:hypothetical protein
LCPILAGCTEEAWAVRYLVFYVWLITFIVWLSLSLNGKKYSAVGFGFLSMILATVTYGAVLSEINTALTNEQIGRMMYRFEEFIKDEEYENVTRLIYYYRDSKELDPLMRIPNALKKVSEWEKEEKGVDNLDSQGATNSE